MKLKYTKKTSAYVSLFLSLITLKVFIEALVLGRGIVPGLSFLLYTLIFYIHYQEDAIERLSVMHYKMVVQGWELFKKADLKLIIVNNSLELKERFRSVYERISHVDLSQAVEFVGLQENRDKMYGVFTSLSNSTDILLKHDILKNLDRKLQSVLRVIENRLELFICNGKLYKDKFVSYHFNEIVTIWLGSFRKNLLRYYLSVSEKTRKLLERYEDRARELVSELAS